MATLVLNRPVIGVTGSAGKTTTKEMIAGVLGTRWKVFKNKYNYNVLNSTLRHARNINKSHRAVVLEYGMAAPGYIRRHCQIIQPNIGIVTNVGSAHIGHFGGSIRRLAVAKSELITHMKPNGLLILNADDKGSKFLLTHRFKGKIVTVGINNEATYNARQIKYAHGGMQFEAYFRNAWHEVYIPLPGQHNVYNALMTIAVADYLDFTPPEIINGFRKMYRNHRRVSMHNLRNGVTVIDDSYSANPHAVKAAIDVLVNVGGGRRILVLGDMRELGSYARKAHREVGAYAAESDIDYFLALGPLMRYAVHEALKHGMPASRVRHFTSRAALHSYLKRMLNEQSTVLIKGSHGSEMFLTADYLRGKRRSKGSSRAADKSRNPNISVPGSRGFAEANNMSGAVNRHRRPPAAPSSMVNSCEERPADSAN